MKRYELIEGSAEIISIMANDGWTLNNTFTNPYPEPYFFALMFIDHPKANEYDVEAIKDNIYRGDTTINKWERSKNIINREKIRLSFISEVPNYTSPF